MTAADQYCSYCNNRKKLQFEGKLKGWSAKQRNAKNLLHSDTNGFVSEGVKSEPIHGQSLWYCIKNVLSTGWIPHPSSGESKRPRLLAPEISTHMSLDTIPLQPFVSRFMWHLPLHFTAPVKQRTTTRNIHEASMIIERSFALWMLTLYIYRLTSNVFGTHFISK